MKKQQQILKKLYDEKRDIFVGYKAQKIFPVRKARTCRNCYFYTFCPFPQKRNPNYKMNDFNHNQNRYKLKPDGYCVPVRIGENGVYDYHGEMVDRKFHEIMELYRTKPAGSGTIRVQRVVSLLTKRGELATAEIGSELWSDRPDELNWQRYCRPAGKLLKKMESDGLVKKRYESGRGYGRTIWRLAN